MPDSAIRIADEVSSDWREQVAAQGMLGKESTIDALQVRQDPHISVSIRASNSPGLCRNSSAHGSDNCSTIVLRLLAEARLSRRWPSPSLACLSGCTGPRCALSWVIRCGQPVRPLICTISCTSFPELLYECTLLPGSQACCTIWLMENGETLCCIRCARWVACWCSARTSRSPGASRIS